MKIGILTLPIETNYGGILQAFALQKVLRDMGHDVLTIDHHWPRHYKSFYHQLRSFTSRCYHHFLKGANVSVAWNGYITDKDYNFISRKTQLFINRNICLTQKVETPQLNRIEDYYKFDAYVVGSDQIWLPYYFPYSFLSFVKREEVLKIVYAASCGKQSWLDFDVSAEQAKLLAQSFKSFSTREAKLAERALEVLHREVVHVLDPTMLLSPTDYLNACKENNSFPEHILFTYVLDNTNEKQTVAAEIGKKLNLEVIDGNVKTTYLKKRGINLEDCTFPSVDRWLQGFEKSKFIVTDSFHGTVFSILFNRPFVVIGNPKRGLERFLSLLSMFGLSHRLVTNLQEAKLCAEQSIDWEVVNKKLYEMKHFSQDFLLKSLQS